MHFSHPFGKNCNTIREALLEKGQAAIILAKLQGHMAAETLFMISQQMNATEDNQKAEG